MIYAPLALGIIAFTFLLISTHVSKKALAFEQLFFIIVEILFYATSAILRIIYPSGVTESVYLVALGLLGLTIVVIFIDYFIYVFNAWRIKT